MRRLRNIGRLFTGTPAGVVEDAAVILDGEEIAWCGKHRDEPRELMEAVTDEHDCAGGLVTAGLIDAHTHPVYAGNRMAEVAMRSAGASYAEVAKAGGGIRATVTATREEPMHSLEEDTARRLWTWLEGGATTVEAKTGYHLSREGELASTRLLARLGQRTDLPRIEVTFLAAHALPPDRWARYASYAKQVAEWCDDAYLAGARFCDVFCDRGYFSVPQSRAILKAGLKAKLIPRIHADELDRTGGARLAAELHAVSADHLLRANRGDAAALAGSGVVATLAPGTALSIGKLPWLRISGKSASREGRASRRTNSSTTTKSNGSRLSGAASKRSRSRTSRRPSRVWCHPHNGVFTAGVRRRAAQLQNWTNLVLF